MKILTLIIVPKKSGSTTITLYTFLTDLSDAKDSANYTNYQVEFRN